MKSWIGTLTAWSLAFLFAEAIGFFVTSELSSFAGTAIALSLGQTVTVVVRMVAIVLLASITGVALSSIYRSPRPTRARVLLATIIATGVLAYLVNLSSGNASRLVQYSNFEYDGEVWTIPFSTAYYLSEVLLLNFLYILGKKSSTIAGSGPLAAIVFLEIGWASLHAVTQSLVTAVFALALVPIYYCSYELTGRSPLTPIFLWFVTLIF